MLPHNAQGLPRYMLVTHGHHLPYSFLSCVSAVQSYCGRVLPWTGTHGWPGWYGRQAGRAVLSAPSAAGDEPQRGFPHGCTGPCAAVVQFIPAMAGRDAPAWRSPPLSKDRQCSLSSFQRSVVLMHSAVLQAYLHCAVKVRGFSWMPSGFPRLPARAVMHSLAVPSRALAATHEGPRL